MTTAADLPVSRRIRRGYSRVDEREMSVKGDPDDDIKDYAETTMNELLGWYGYEKVDSKDTQGLNLHHFASTSEPNASPPNSVQEGSDESGDQHSRPPLTLNGNRTPPSNSRAGSASPEGLSMASDEVARQHQQMVSALSSVPKHPGAPDSPNLPPGCIVCAWCQKVGMKLFTLKTPNGCKAFCSELCFTQCRRASFKKNKICDWCKHVRHTVNYVDFQDGEQQLQFCSDKCLNQYKMNIFCKETQAHLKMHTHLKEAACKMAAGGNVNLITPELWLRDCQSQSNGGIISPKPSTEVIDGSISDETSQSENSTPKSLETPRPASPGPNEKPKLPRPSYGRPEKVRDKHSRRSGRPHSRSSGPKSDRSSRSPSHKNKDKKKNSTTTDNGGGRNHSVPPLPGMKPLTNGLSPLCNTSPTLPPQLHPSLTQNSPVMDHFRPPYMPPGMVPNSFQFFAQHHMETMMRAQNRMNMRPNAPTFPIPPWGMHPFPHGPPLHPPPPPPPPPPAIPTTASSSNFPSHSHNHHHHQQQQHQHHTVKAARSGTQSEIEAPTSKPSTNKSKQSTHSKTIPTASAIPTSPTKPPPVPPSTLLPPVTVMVPFPVVLPVPFPIPIPIPIPDSVFEKFRRQKSDKNPPSETFEDLNQSPTSKTSSDAHTLGDYNKDIESVANESGTIDLSVNKVQKQSPERVPASDSGYWADNRFGSSSHKQEENRRFTAGILPVLANERIFGTGAISENRMDTDHDSRSYSSLSEAVSVEEGEEEEEEEEEDTADEMVNTANGRGLQGPFAPSRYGSSPSSLADSTTISSVVSAHRANADRTVIRREPSTEKRKLPVMSTAPRNCKRSCTPQGLNLVMYKESA